MSRVSFALILALSLMAAGCGGYGNSMGSAPTLTSLTPNTVTAGDPAFTLTVNGSGFGTDSVVFWNGAALPTAYGTGSRVTAQVPATDVLAAGAFPVYVRSGGKNSAMMDFTVQE